jgi:hypothetical protein
LLTVVYITYSRNPTTAELQAGDPTAPREAVGYTMLSTSSHYVTHADFGCLDGVHKSWIIAEVENKEEARRILPPIYRSKAKIVGLDKFKLDEVNQLLLHHEKGRLESGREHLLGLVLDRLQHWLEPGRRQSNPHLR